MTSYTNITDGPLIQSSNISYQNLNLTTNITMEWPTNLANNDKPVTIFMRVDCDVANLTIRLDSVVGISEGQYLLFHNIGGQSFRVRTLNNGTVSTVAAGQVVYAYLASKADATDEDGVWQSFTFGTGTSNVIASALAGPGLKAEVDKLETNIVDRPIPVVGVAPVEIPPTDRAKFIYTNDTGVATFTFQTIANYPAGWYVLLQNTSQNGAAITVLPFAGDFIDGKTTLVLNPGEGRMIVRTTANGWRTFHSIGDPVVPPTPPVIPTAGTGLINIANAFNTNIETVNASGDRPIALADRAKLIHIQTGVPRTFTLNNLAGFPIGWYVLVKNSIASTASLTIAAAAGETIDGVTTTALAAGEGFMVVRQADNDDWITF